MALQVPFVHKYCSCNDDLYNPTPIGKLQKDFEELRLSGLSNYEALQKMKVTRLCCREALFNPCMIFLNSENKGRISDDTGHLAPREPGKIVRPVDSQIDTAAIVPKRELPSLP